MEQEAPKSREIDRFHRAAHGQLFAVLRCGKALIPYIISGTGYPVSNPYLWYLVWCAMWYHEGTTTGSIFFALPCGRVAAQSLFALANLGTTAAAAVVTLPSATEREQFAR